MINIKPTYFKEYNPSKGMAFNHKVKLFEKTSFEKIDFNQKKEIVKGLQFLPKSGKVVWDTEADDETIAKLDEEAEVADILAGLGAKEHLTTEIRDQTWITNTKLDMEFSSLPDEVQHVINTFSLDDKFVEKDGMIKAHVYPMVRDALREGSGYSRSHINKNQHGYAMLFKEYYEKSLKTNLPRLAYISALALLKTNTKKLSSPVKAKPVKAKPVKE